MVARYGAKAAADSEGSAGAGPLYGDDYARLRRAVARYERSQTAAPDGYPERGLGALLHIGALAGRRRATPRAADAALRDRCAGSALPTDARDRDRRQRQTPQVGSQPHATPAQPATTRIPADLPHDKLAPAGSSPTERQERHCLTSVGCCSSTRGRVVLAPAPSSEHYRTVIRDAYLLAGQPAAARGRRPPADGASPPGRARARTTAAATERRGARAARACAPHRPAAQPPKPPLGKLPRGVARRSMPTGRRSGAR